MSEQRLTIVVPAEGSPFAAGPDDPRVAELIRGGAVPERKTMALNDGTALDHDVIRQRLLDSREYRALVDQLSGGPPAPKSQLSSRIWGIAVGASLLFLAVAVVFRAMRGA